MPTAPRIDRLLAAAAVTALGAALLLWPGRSVAGLAIGSAVRGAAYLMPPLLFVWYRRGDANRWNALREPRRVWDLGLGLASLLLLWVLLAGAAAHAGAAGLPAGLGFYWPPVLGLSGEGLIRFIAWLWRSFTWAWPGALFALWAHGGRAHVREAVGAAWIAAALITLITLVVKPAAPFLADAAFGTPMVQAKAVLVLPWITAPPVPPALALAAALALGRLQPWWGRCAAVYAALLGVAALILGVSTPVELVLGAAVGVSAAAAARRLTRDGSAA